MSEITPPPGFALCKKGPLKKCLGPSNDDVAMLIDAKNWSIGKTGDGDSQQYAVRIGSEIWELNQDCLLETPAPNPPQSGNPIPNSVPKPPEGWLYYGMKPLPGRHPHSAPNIDIAHLKGDFQWSCTNPHWAGSTGGKCQNHYAVKAGTPLAYSIWPEKKTESLNTPPPRILNPWACQVLECASIEYDAKAEDLYLQIVNERDVNNRIFELAEKEHDFQELATETARVISRFFHEQWIEVTSRRLGGYVLGRVLDDFMPTTQNITVIESIERAALKDPFLSQHPALSRLQAKESPTQPPTNMTTNSAYSSIPIATPTLIYGQDINDMDDEDLITAIRGVQDRIDGLVKIPGNSKKVARQIKEAEAAKAKLVEKLDEGEKAE